jgi:hypothetical protein
VETPRVIALQVPHPHLDLPHASPDKLLHEPGTRKGVISIYAGKSHKRFDIHTAFLEQKSPYFKRILAENQGHDKSSQGTPDQQTYEDADEVSMLLFKHWVEDGDLGGPHDFHSFQHYLGLYILARKFETEQLENQSESRNPL